MIKEYKPAILFLIKFVLIYVALNTAYSYYILYYSPNADPLTIVVTQQTESLLSVFDQTINYKVIDGSMNVPVRRGGETIMMVYEGCNSINVMIVFVAFIISFKGPSKLFIRYFILGLLGVYGINILRLMGLYMVTLVSPGSFYFFHKFFFTGVIYAVVFVIWYFWIADVKRWKLEKSTSSA